MAHIGVKNDYEGKPLFTLRIINIQRSSLVCTLKLHRQTHLQVEEHILCKVLWVLLPRQRAALTV